MSIVVAIPLYVWRLYTCIWYISTAIRNLTGICTHSHQYSYDKTVSRLFLRYVATTVLSLFFKTWHGGPLGNYWMRKSKASILSCNTIEFIPLYFSSYYWIPNFIFDGHNLQHNIKWVLVITIIELSTLWNCYKSEMSTWVRTSNESSLVSALISIHSSWPKFVIFFDSVPFKIHS